MRSIRVLPLILLPIIAFGAEHRKDADDLIQFSNNANTGSAYSGTTVYLDTDIGHSGKSLDVFGEVKPNYFQGSLDEKKRAVRDIKVDSDSDYSSLFSDSDSDSSDESEGSSFISSSFASESSEKVSSSVASDDSDSDDESEASSSTTVSSVKVEDSSSPVYSSEKTSSSVVSEDSNVPSSVTSESSEKVSSSVASEDSNNVPSTIVGEDSDSDSDSDDESEASSSTTVSSVKVEDSSSIASSSTVSESSGKTSSSVTSESSEKTSSTVVSEDSNVPSTVVSEDSNVPSTVVGEDSDSDSDDESEASSSTTISSVKVEDSSSIASSSVVSESSEKTSSSVTSESSEKVSSSVTSESSEKTSSTVVSEDSNVPSTVVGEDSDSDSDDESEASSSTTVSSVKVEDSSSFVSSSEKVSSSVVSEDSKVSSSVVSEDSNKVSSTVVGEDSDSDDESDSSVESESKSSSYSGEPLKKCKITFNAMGGKVDEESKEVTHDQKYGELPEATRDGYRFDGWFTEEVGGDEIKAENTVENAEDHTLYAHWTAREYIITFNATGGKVDEETREVTFDQKYGKLPEATKDGYKFDGWFTEEVDGDEIKGDDDVKITSNTMFYAHWTGAEYTVTFNATGGDVEEETKKVIYGAKYGELPVPTKKGYTFAGWFTEEDDESGDKITDASDVKITEDHTLYAHWVAHGHTVTLDAMGGKIEDPTKVVTYGAKYGKFINATRDGYTFDGWFTEEVDGKEVTGEDTVEVDGDHTLYAHWTANNYTVTFDAMSGKFDEETREVTFDEEYGEILDATRDGYIFDGWFTEEVDGDKITGESPVKIAEDHTLYAHWTARKYTVTFNATGGEVEEPTREVTFDQEYGKLPDPTKDGYKFDGWFTEDDESGVQITGEDTVKIFDDHTLYAHWTARKYNVTFNATGGKVEESYREVTYDTKYGKFIDATRDGYTFDGWFTEEIDGVEVTGDDDVKITSNTMLYAHWTANKYTITFNATDGTIEESEATKEVIYDQEYGKLPVLTLEGYDFRGWFFKENGVGEEITNKTIVKVTEATTLYAYWTASIYTITFNATGGSVKEPTIKVTYDSEYGVFDDATRDGYTFNGWFTEEIDGDQITSELIVKTSRDQTLYAHWTVNNYTVTFDGVDGVIIEASRNVTYDQIYGDFYNATRDGYTFDGWYTKKVGGDEITNETIVKIANDHTLYAHWIANKYTVTYNATIGTVKEPSKVVTYDQEYGELPDPTKDGYTFVGWFTEEGGNGEHITKTTIVKIIDHQTIYANWTVNSYKVTFDATGGKGPEPKIVTYDEEYGELVNATRDGYTFNGWFTQKDGKGNEVINETMVKIIADQTLYAYWIANQYTVSFNATTGELPDSESTKEFTYDQKYVSLPKPTKVGYTFSGWFSDDDGKGTQTKEGDTVKIIEDTTLYAYWIANVFTITFNTTGGSVKNPTTKVTYDSEYGVFNNATRDGYTFVGWFNESGDQVTSELIVKIIADATLIAHWDANNYTVTFNATYGEAVEPSKNVTYDETYGEFFDATRDGYRFDGWFNAKGLKVTSEDTVKILEDSTLYAYWTAQNYTIEFNATGGNGPEPKMVTFDDEYGVLYNASYRGYTFDGWHTAMDNSGEHITSDIIVKTSRNQTLYAHWIANQYTVSFNATTGDLMGATDSKIVTYDEKYGELPQPQMTGYSFYGWYTKDSLFGSHVTEDTVVRIIKNQTLYALWNAKRFVVSFNGAGGTAMKSAMNATYDKKYDKLPNAIREGYGFGGWFTEEDGKGVQIKEGDVVKITEDTTLYAKWTAGVYTLTLYSTGGNVSKTSFTIAYDEKYPELPEATRTGYTFMGWFTSRIDGEKITSESVFKSKRDQSIYAQWAINSYTITFDLGNGTVTEQVLDYDSKVTYPRAYSREGYTYQGWDVVVKRMPAENVTATLRWSINSYAVMFDYKNGTVVREIIKYHDGLVYPSVPVSGKANLTFTWKPKVKIMPARNFTVTGQWKEATLLAEVVFASTAVTNIEVTKIVKQYTSDAFNIEGVNNGVPVGRTQAIISFGDYDKLNAFVEKAKESMLEAMKSGKDSELRDVSAVFKNVQPGKVVEAVRVVFNDILTRAKATDVLNKYVGAKFDIDRFGYDFGQGTSEADVKVKDYVTMFKFVEKMDNAIKSGTETTIKEYSFVYNE